MKVIKPGFVIEDPIEIDGDRVLQFIEKAGRTCYKSEDKITPDSAKAFVKKIIKSGHTSVIEHAKVSVRIICDRGITHEIVRHRIGSYSQESTRYCNYGKDKHGSEITVILPFWFEQMHLMYGDRLSTCMPRQIPQLINEIISEHSANGRELEDTAMQYFYWYLSCRTSEEMYLLMIANGSSPQEARSVLMNSLKTEIVCTLNLRSWINFFQQRTPHAAHPQMREIAIPLLECFSGNIPVVFDNVKYLE